jgi:hypothetical protein
MEIYTNYTQPDKMIEDIKNALDKKEDKKTKNLAQ